MAIMKSKDKEHSLLSCLLDCFVFFPLQVLQNASFMPNSHSRKHVVSTSVQTVQILDEIIRKNFNEWSQKLDGQLLKKLEQPLLVRCKDTPAKLDVNFDKWVNGSKQKKQKLPVLFGYELFASWLVLC